MSFDFFNQPQMGSSSKLIFSQSERACFSRQLAILDPQNTQRISATSALELIRFSGLSNNLMKQIWILSNPSSDNLLTYDQVQTMIRLVGYAQSGIPLTRENLERNLNHNQPVFQHESLASIPTNTAITVGLSDTDILNYEKVWAAIDGKTDDMIGGSDVKRLYQTAANKKMLAKAWTLCSQTQKGYLTKGELFVFLYLINLIKMNQELPLELTNEMRGAMAKIDANIKRGPPKQAVKAVPQQTNESRRLQQVENVEKRNLENLKGLGDGQAKFTNLVSWVEKFVEQSETTMNQMQSEIQRIKTAQVQTFQKMNGGIMKLQRVIQRQNLVIQELVNQLRNRDNTDQEHIRTLESVHEKQIDNKANFNSNRSDKKPETSQMSQGNFQKKSSFQESKIPNKQPQPSAQPEHQQSNQQQHKQNPLDAYQIQTLNLLNQVRPISPEELPAIQKRIMSMSKDELQEFYAEVVKRYQELQQEKEKQVSAAAQKSEHKSPNSSDLEFVAGILGNVEINPDEMKQPEEDFFK